MTVAGDRGPARGPVPGRLLVVLLLVALPLHARGEPSAEPPRLAFLAVGGAGDLTPAFAPDVRHYAVRCEERQTLRVSAAAAGADVRLRLNGVPSEGPLADVPVRLAGDEVLVVEVEASEAAAPGAVEAPEASAPGAAERAAYIVHCVAPDFPDVEVLRKAPGRAPGLLLVTPYYNAPDADTGAPASWLALLDDDGVPRFRRRVSPGAHNFRWHEHARRYSYNEAPPNGAGDVVLLDERLAEVARVGTVAGLAPAMMHEFLITEEGNYLFVVNEPAVRDFGRYPAPAPNPDPNPASAPNPDPDPDPASDSAPDSDSNPASASAPDPDPDRPAPSSAEPTRDSVIQEVTPDGREVFRWNAWEHLKLSDCRWRLFPREYAKLNSLHLSSGGDLIASFRACSTILKIERPSGRVLWQLGGSDPAEPDPFDTSRPTFDRPWYRPAGDPRGGFCAQHTALETAPGRILLFDNGQCPDGDRPSSRVVEYQLGPGGAGGEAAFVRHHEPGRLAVYGGAVAPLPNGNWLIAWGAGPGDGATLSEVAPSGAEVLALRIFRNEHPAMTYRVQRHPGAQPPPPSPATTARAAAPESPPGRRASER